MTTLPSTKFTVPSPRLGVNFAFAYVYVVWGGTYLAVHLALAGFPPFLLSGSRFLLAGFLLMALLRVVHPKQFDWGTRREWGDAAVVGTLLLVTGIGAVNWAQQYVTSSVAALIFGALPIWIILVDWLRPRGTAPDARACCGLALGFLGVFILLAPGATSQPSGSIVGKLVLIVAGLSWAIGAIYSRHTVVRGSPFLPMSRQMIVAGALLLIASVVHGDLHRFHPGAVTAVAWTAFAYLVLCGSVTGFTAYIWLMRVSTTVRTATIPYVNLAIAVLLGCTFDHEPFGWNMILGAGTIVAAVLLVMQKPKAALPPADGVLQ
jgi:drug/metabolite transporter (DMT)-like permease